MSEENHEGEYIEIDEDEDNGFEEQEWEILDLGEGKGEKKTDIVVEKGDKVDVSKCPYCKSPNIGKDLKLKVYHCFDCGKTYDYK